MGTKCFIPSIVIVSLLLILSGCETLKASKPIVPIKEYERMIVGRIDANYVGTKTCLQSCHFHDKHRRDFEASTMGAQLSSKSGMPIVDCESCHGPGSLAIEGLTEEKVKQDKENGIETKCKYDTLIDLKNLPAPAKSLICLKCHTANATFNLHNWNASTHNINDVSCSDCHNIHAGPDLIVRPRDTFKMCFQCHQDIDAEFSLPSHHPIHEKRIFCIDCHDAHGTITEGNLREQTVKATCTKCHGEKEGPFTYEHAENTEDRGSCHSPHGSVNNNLLTVSEPYLCFQCHAPHRTITGIGLGFRCTDCHSTIHGTDIPAPGGASAFTQ